ncbi:hypothetical protein OH491_25345 [Termitidicoccus mucosus]|uniref:Uncharacterized protein n=1 Tax=Termitidicoccus mucosus TaxID=1184151 RepID=A0A178IPU3_9BACT|nr:hypothetical protein AW736_01205 [Opitutaceae bacterium TSB47]
MTSVPKTAAALLALCTVVLALAVPASAASENPAPNNTLLIEPETFAVLGPWDAKGNHIRSSNRPAVALAGFEIAEPGEYQVWTRSLDSTDNEKGARRFLLRIDGNPLDRESGQHGRDGLWWENVGARDLAAGAHTLEIDDTRRHFGRLEAILLTRTAFDPNSRERESLRRFYRPVIQPERVFPATAAPTPPGPGAKPLVEIRNADIAVRFFAAKSADGAPLVWRETVFLTDGDRLPPLAHGVEPLLAIAREPDAKAAFWDDVFPSWTNKETTAWRVAGREVTLAADIRDPFVAGSLLALPPAAVRALGPRSAETTCRSADGSLSATLRWTLPESGHLVRVEAEFSAPRDAFWSMAFAPGPLFPKSAVSAVQLPPLYQYRRLPVSPRLLLSSKTPHPLALVTARPGGFSRSVTVGVLADPETLTADWPAYDNASHGFTLTGLADGAQAHVFSPVPGGKNSRAAQGGRVSAAWQVAAAPLPWDAVMREADARLWKVRDYREPFANSLTEQALNLAGLLGDDAHAFWLPELKGPANIEAPSTVTHAAPLAYLAAATLARDADFYRRRALPTLEFLLSRPETHFALNAENNSYLSPKGARIAFDNSAQPAAVWEGADALLGRLNPWLRGYVDRQNHATAGQNTARAPGWSGRLALLRSQPSSPGKLLDDAVAEAAAWAARSLTANPARPLSESSFYNTSMYPAWWELLDLYELRNDRRLLDAAVDAAQQTVAGLYVHPVLPDANAPRTLNKGGSFSLRAPIWWGDGVELSRLGWTEEMLPKPRKRRAAPTTLALPEQIVPAWLTSPVGLGIEQPTSVQFAYRPPMSLIMLSSWAANLLRLSAITGDDYWRIFARGTLIGRAASYPGYYLTDHIAAFHRPDYPKNGPDLTSLYWHHVPPHFAMVLDYLFTDAETRTGGAVRFPYVRQLGYVWFSNRLPSGAPGKVFDDADCRPWLDRKAFGVDTPKVDFIGARSPGKFHLILLNQALGDTTARVRVDEGLTGVAEKTPALLRTKAGDGGSLLPRDADGRLTVSLPRGGWAVLSFDARREDFWPSMKPLETAPVKLDLPEGWGEGRAFRIRSPFGFDSVFVALTGRPAQGHARLVFDDGGLPPINCDTFPYEFTAADISPSQDITLRLRLELPGQAAIETPPVTLKGTR